MPVQTIELITAHSEVVNYKQVCRLCAPVIAAFAMLETTAAAEQFTTNPQREEDSLDLQAESLCQRQTSSQTE